MEIFTIKNLSFTYPSGNEAAIRDISFEVKKGEFVTLCGKSGCGKTTLLRLLKREIAPSGKLKGEILYCGRELSAKVAANEIGFVMQNPDNQLVTDKVWHELAFGLESMGVKNNEIRMRVAEMASFFGINKWFHKKVTELSGGQKQLLNLASVMVMNPEVLILDEPTSRLDPLYAETFINTLKKINRELGKTVIIAEHNLGEVFEISDRIVVMESGRVIVSEKPRDIAGRLKGNDMYDALPGYVAAFDKAGVTEAAPLSVREARNCFFDYSLNNKLNELPLRENTSEKGTLALELKDVWFRYEKNGEDILKGINIKAHEGEIYAVMGGNGAGKTTTMSLIGGAYAPYRGKVFIYGAAPRENRDIVGILPQNPQALFLKKTVSEDLSSIAEDEKTLAEAVRICKLGKLLSRHPYDLSGGEQQRAALAKVLLAKPRLILLDEPTKGMDARFKKIFGGILLKLKESGVCVIMVSHDTEFCAEYADKCAMLFDGQITAEANPREFFSANSFYTTPISLVSRGIADGAVTAEDIIYVCTGKIQDKQPQTEDDDFFIPKNREEKNKKKADLRLIFCGILAAVFVILQIIGLKGSAGIATAAVLGVIMIIVLPKKSREWDRLVFKEKEKLTARRIAPAVAALTAIPVTLAGGIVFLHDRKYFFISILMVIETLALFFTVFESRRPRARELVLISVLCGIAVSGRAAFFMLPHFKPMSAVIIICGCLLGSETGFLVGAVSAFVSNFFYRQGPWTPWQMFAFGTLGLVAGLLTRSGIVKRNKAAVSVFGFFAVVIIYGGIMNPAAVIMSMNGEEINRQMFMAAYITGFPLDLVHAASTAVFLWFISDEFAEKLERIKLKYGLDELG